MELSLERGELRVKCLLSEGMLWITYYRGPRVGLRIHEKIRGDLVEEIKEILSRPPWLGQESDDLIRECLKQLMESVRDEKS